VDSDGNRAGAALQSKETAAAGRKGAILSRGNSGSPLGIRGTGSRGRGILLLRL